MLAATVIVLTIGALSCGTAALTLNRRERTASAAHRRGDPER